MNIQSSIANDLVDAVDGLIKEYGELEPGEMVIHFDLVATTLRIKDSGEPHRERRHWATAGADPHTSYGVLHAEAAYIEKWQLT